MSRVHDALRKMGLETAQRSGITETLGATKECEVSKNLEFLHIGKAGPRSSIDPPPNSHARHQSNGKIVAQEGGPKSEEKGRVLRQFGSDPPPRGGQRRPSALSDGAQDQVVKLVQRVFVFPNSGAPRLVVFSSVEEGSGSSEICFRSCEALATQVAGSVCLVDANLRAPSLHQLSGVENFPGLTDAIINPRPIKDFAVRIAHGNLWLVPPGSRAVDAPGLFASEQLCSRMLELKEEFDYVLVDAPPVSSYSDAVLLGQMSDGVILVVEANSTRRETARIAKETFEGANVKLLGVILNNRTFPIPAALYRKL